MIEIIAYVLLALACLFVLAGIVFTVLAYASQVAYRDPDYSEFDDENL